MGGHQFKGVRPSVTIYTDGSCNPNPGPGGWGVVLQGAAAAPLEAYGSAQYTTNNRMELTAAIRGLEALRVPCNVRLFTDSQYVLNGITKWARVWQRNGWRNANRHSVSNVDLWRRLILLSDRHDIEWIWIKGHSGDEGNERADALALQGRLEVLNT